MMMVELGEISSREKIQFVINVSQIYVLIILIIYEDKNNKFKKQISKSFSQYASSVLY